MKALFFISTLFLGTQKPVVPTITLLNPKYHQEELAFTAVENPPSFPGGQAELYRFLRKNLAYPSEAMKNKVGGKVILRFIVEKDGLITHIELVKGIGYGCDLEAIRVVKSMPNWIPGKQSFNTVRCFYHLPIVFTVK